jgi:hypothetical protein
VQQNQVVGVYYLEIKDYFLKLECHNFSYLCTEQFEDARVDWLLSS